MAIAEAPPTSDAHAPAAAPAMPSRGSAGM